MDVQLITSGVLDLPSSQRVDAIVHDGATDLTLWMPPGPDRELLQHYGDELPKVLERERGRKPEDLAIGEAVRLHRGKLHCDFLLWVATRPGEDRGIRSPAPSAEIISKAVADALGFCSERHVDRVAIGPLGAGPGELGDVERLVIVARAASAYYEACYAQGRAAGIEEVLVCHPFSSRIGEARRKLGRTVSVVKAPTPAPSSSSSSRRRSSGGAPRKRAPRKVEAPTPPPALSYGEIGKARATGRAYDMATKYEPGEYMIHSKFGVGRIEAVTPEGYIVVLFQEGTKKRLLHNKP